MLVPEAELRKNPDRWGSKKGEKIRNAGDTRLGGHAQVGQW